MPPERANIQVCVAQTLEVEVLSAINRAGGLITDIRAEKEHSARIGATIPRKNLAPFGVWLRDISKGQGHLSEDPCN